MRPQQDAALHAGINDAAEIDRLLDLRVEGELVAAAIGRRAGG